MDKLSIKKASIVHWVKFEHELGRMIFGFNKLSNKAQIFMEIIIR